MMKIVIIGQKKENSVQSVISLYPTCLAPRKLIFPPLLAKKNE
jgi:hypothetical protein